MTDKLLTEAHGTLTETEVIPYLRERGLVDGASVVDGDIRVLDVSRRNRNFRVLRSAGPSFLLKQGVARDSFSAVAREARAYELFGPLPHSVGAGSSPAFRHAPTAYAYDDERDVLVLELVTGVENLRVRHRRARRPPRDAARAVGRALAALHQLVPATVDLATAQRLLGAGEPGVLSVQRPGLSMLRDFSSACVDLVRMVQAAPDVPELLAGLRQDWRTDTLIHHDVRWDNFLLPLPRARNGARGRREVMLVDWETAALGDPCWDVGAVFGEYLGDWLSSVPGVAGEPPERFLHLARCPLESVQPAVRSFWSAYVGQAGLAAGQASEHLLRSVRYSGLKLVQSGLEQVQRSARWTVCTVSFLQVGVNILTRPEEAGAVLLGLGGVA
ncbi:MAG TPA: phosphotransferase [Mycobacteriales bacterium]|nr:phosphotransferase [Mycobacteriales bacterium]